MALQPRENVLGTVVAAIVLILGAQPASARNAQPSSIAARYEIGIAGINVGRFTFEANTTK
ncbi:MAG: hypothetical protein AAF732_07040, partial [Pseudomonadota bacterium]